jgi:hypothetical protein
VLSRRSHLTGLFYKHSNVYERPQWRALYHWNVCSASEVREPSTRNLGTWIGPCHFGAAPEDIGASAQGRSRDDSVCVSCWSTLRGCAGHMKLGTTKAFAANSGSLNLDEFWELW